MDLRYQKYLRPNAAFYEPPVNENDDVAFTLALPEGWKKNHDAHWMFLVPPGTQLPAQGWKIHITTRMQHDEVTLKRVAEMMFARGVAFKHVRTRRELVLKNSKYSDRGSSGKFITIYPASDEQFVDLLRTLDAELADLPAGPYILSDRRWGTGNVFYRYGSFALQEFVDEDGRRRLGVRDPDGTMVADDRQPVYHVPDFVSVPYELERMQEQQDAVQQDPLPYQVESALHHSNGGGVYLASAPEIGKLVLKEARPGAGLDAQGRDAVERLEHEAEIMRRLADVRQVPELYGRFQVWEHSFLAEAHIPGTTLNSWAAAYYPFGRGTDITDYVDSCLNIVGQLVEAIEALHARGVGMGDLQPENVMITEDNEVFLIDFEAAGDVNDTRHSGLITMGFSPVQGGSRRELDNFALSRIARFVFLPIGPVLDLAPSMHENHLEWIRRNFGDRAAAVVERCDARVAESTVPPLAVCVAPARPLSGTAMDDAMASLRRGLLDVVDAFGERLSPGDIRQYETDGGIGNVSYGAAGVVMALERTGGAPAEAIDWLERWAGDLPDEDRNVGLLDGLAGVSGVLAECGRGTAAWNLLNRIDIADISHDVGIRTGMAGVGLAYLDVAHRHDRKEYLERAADIARRIDEAVARGVQPVVDDLDGIPIGLLDGWSGVALFLTGLGVVSGEGHWLQKARGYVEKDLALCETKPDGTFQIRDGARVVPYVAGGSGGVAIAAIHLNRAAGTDSWGQELRGIARTSVSRCFYGAGLFRGAAGLVAASTMLDTAPGISGPLVPRSLETLNLFLVEHRGELAVPGDFVHRLSTDLATGAAGVLMTLAGAKGRALPWLPIPSADEIFGLGAEGSPIQRKGGDRP